MLLEVVQYAGLQGGRSIVEASVNAHAVSLSGNEFDVGQPVGHRIGAPKSDDRGVRSRISQQNDLPIGSRIILYTDVRGRRVEVLACSLSPWCRNLHGRAIPRFDCTTVGHVRNRHCELLQQVCRVVVPMRQQYVRPLPAVCIRRQRREATCARRTTLRPAPTCTPCPITSGSCDVGAPACATTSRKLPRTGARRRRWR